MKSVFISHVHEDGAAVEAIKNWETKGLLPGIRITFETEDKRAEGREAIKNYLREKIRGAAVVLVLVGDNTHNHDWIRAEVELANSFHIQLICMRLNGTTGAKPPILINHQEVPFHPNQIVKLVK
jgi:hypothetical protein